MPDAAELLQILDEEIVACRKCPRLVAYREQVAREKRRAYRDWVYWGKPVPGFGDPRAQLVLVGLAPGPTGRTAPAVRLRATRRESSCTRRCSMRDSRISRWPCNAMTAYSCTRRTSRRQRGARLPTTSRCPSELLNCRPYLERELEILKPRAVLALGKIGWDVYLGILKHQGLINSRAAYPFSHGAESDIPAAGTRLFGAYHPSQQNTATGKVTPAMYAKVLRRIQCFLEK